MNYKVEIWFKGVDDPVYCTVTDEELDTLGEYIGQKCVLSFSDDWGGVITVYLKDAYAYNSQKVAVQEDNKSISDDEIKHYIL